MKKIYIVRGSEDGNIGAFSSLILAYNRAITYVSGVEGREPNIDVKNNNGYIRVPATLKIARIKINETGICVLSTDVEAIIEEFVVNAA